MWGKTLAAAGGNRTLWPAAICQTGPRGEYSWCQRVVSFNRFLHMPGTDARYGANIPRVLSKLHQRMSRMFQRMDQLWNDDQGAIISAEFLFVTTILVIGIVVGLSAVRDAINVELSELANALLALSQGFSINGTTNGNASADGSQAIDFPSTVTPPTSTPPAIPSVIDITPN